MKCRVVSGEPAAFKPISLELVIETLEELKEFELRMALYRSRLLEAAAIQTDLELRHPAYKPSQPTYANYTSIRKLLHELAGSDSLITNPSWPWPTSTAPQRRMA
jgi:hypothetical protein